MYFKNFGITLLSKYHDHDLLSCLLAITQITLKLKQEFPGLVNFTFFPFYFAILSSKDDISFHL